MQKQLLPSTKMAMLVASLISFHLAKADFGIDEALQEMMHSVEKIQKKFTKINNSVHTSMSNLMQGTFSQPTGSLAATKDDEHVMITVNMNDIDKDSIKAVVHNKELTIKAHNQHTEIELIVVAQHEPHTVKMNMSQKVEKESEETGKNADKKTMLVSYNAQQIMQTLPAEISLDDVVVEYENGILTVKLKRANPIVSPKVINVIKK